MAETGDKFTRKKDDAIVALLTQRNIEDAARTAGIGIRTMMRWLKREDFQKAYREARRAAFEQSIARLQQASSAAVSTLLKVMIDPSSPPSSKVRAADSVLNHTIRAVEVEDVEVRLTALENSAEQQSST